MQLVWAIVTWVLGSVVVGWVLSRPRLAGQDRPRGWAAGRERTLSIVICVLAVLTLAQALVQLAAGRAEAGGWVELGAATMLGGGAVGSIVLRRRRLSEPAPRASE